MLRQYELVNKVTDYEPQADEGLLNRAYIFATQKHGGQTRASGDPYFSHPIEVAGILTDLKLDTASIATALLHDTIEDTDTNYDEVKNLFGEEIADLVDGVTKLSQLELNSMDSAHAENFRKLLLATAKDIRILLVKLADRLHNMRTLHFIKTVEKRTRIAQETMDIYAPLAGRLGMNSFREELEDLSFAELNPKARELVCARLTQLSEDSGAKLDEISYTFHTLLSEKNVAAQVFGRQKRPFSIWRKMQNKSISLEQLADIFGYRVIVDTEDECYRVLGILHRHYRYVPGRYKDYISTPKINGYRSLHTTIIGPDNQRVEVQIRTTQMDNIAENGVAAHWTYKDINAGLFDAPSCATPNMETMEAFTWLREMIEQIRNGGTAEEFLENTKLELFTDQVFCFTPKGRLIALPRGATALDFAYAVHTEIGNHCEGVRINGNKRPRRTILRNGDEIEVMRSEVAMPQQMWLQHVSTGKARSAIRHALREGEQVAYTKLGRSMVQSAFETHNATHDKDIIQRALGVLGYDSLDTLYAAVGRGTLSTMEILHEILPGNREGGMGNAFRRLVRRRKQQDKKPPALPVGSGRYGMAVRFADNHFPLPGDAIVGIATMGQGLVVYPAQAAALNDYEGTPERWVEMLWDKEHINKNRLFQSRFKMTVANQAGSLSTIAQTIADFDANIINLAVTQRNDDFCDLTIDLEVLDAAHADKLVAALSGISVISVIRRIQSPEENEI